MKAYGFGMYGMWGPVTDPGEAEFCQKVAALGVDIGASPYRDYDVNTIVAAINVLPSGVCVLVWGSSLGANNSPVVGSYTNRTIDGMWGFQASLYGAQVPITSNVKFAHEVYNPNLLETGGLGAYQWQVAAGNRRTNLYTSVRYDLHPGETESAQAMFLAEMKRVIGA
jgi:hypothetical protein